MRLSKSAYFADMGIYAAVCAALFTVAMWTGGWAQRMRWAAAAATGVAAWSLLEYLLHRFMFHGSSGIARLHAEHHRFPRAFIGTPTWLSLGVWGVLLFLPTWQHSSLTTASGLTTGVCFAYLWYGIVHHVIHHHRPRFLAARLSGAAYRHFRHHNPEHCGNFGVTTPLWDHIFGTYLGARHAAARTTGRRRARLFGRRDGTRAPVAR